jgi:hypothetical protein
MTAKPKQESNKNQNNSLSSNSPLDKAASRLQDEYRLREQTMASNLLAIEQSNAFLIDLLKRMQQLNLKSHSVSIRSEINDIIELIREQLNNDNWDHFERFFMLSNNRFIQSLTCKHPDLTSTEKRLCMLLQMNLSTKEISGITMQSCRAIEMARHRLRLKFGLSRDENIQTYFSKIIES